ncbi:hypothetical protein [Azorhizobium sp. AG788]|uniref:hypothetical protein n=1 Tax=Azorhizobium sp. AG788 TaxID=2183897 RepID=UPI00313915C0
MARFTLSQQMEEVQFELDRRASEYPRQIASRKLGRSVAQYHVDRLTAARDSLSWLHDNLALIRERCPELFKRGG